jgi:hypothetical protein
LRALASGFERNRGITGKLPEDKENMLEMIRKYQMLPDEERLIYRVGRRGGAYGSLEDLDCDPETYQKVKDLVQEITEKEGIEGVEKLITQMVDRTI